MVNAISTSTESVEMVMKNGLQSTQQCTKKVRDTEKSWAEVEEVMINIENHVNNIETTVSDQLMNLENLSDNFSAMDTNFSDTQRAIDLCNIISEDIIKIGKQLRNLTSKFNVTESNFSTKRRDKFRISEEES